MENTKAKQGGSAMPKVTLISWTNDPIRVIYNCFMNMHNKISSDLTQIHLDEKELNDFFDMLNAQPHQTVFEFVNTVWLIEEASRAFQQQLTRTRQASYSIQSLRVVQLKTFADDGAYTKSSALKMNPEAEKKFDETMRYIQKSYRELLDMGCPTEDARGILPLNIHSPITMSINLRALYHMLELRFCENAQEEYRQVAQQMKEEIATKIHPIFTKPMVPICFRLGKCPSPFPCGKYGFKHDVKMDVSRWIKG
jgi:thymidylate synthase (FAD)